MVCTLELQARAALLLAPATRTASVRMTSAFRIGGVIGEMVGSLKVALTEESRPWRRSDASVSETTLTFQSLGAIFRGVKAREGERGHDYTAAS